MSLYKQASEDRMMDFELFADLVRQASVIFEESSLYQLIDGALYWTFAQFPRNDDERGVLIKTALLITIYKTPIFDVLKIAQHIHRNGAEIDAKIASGDVSVIDQIRQGHGIGKKGGKKKDFFVFATKYAHFHNPDAFPIFDKVVKDYLYLLNNDELPFYDEFTKTSIEKSYPQFKDVLDTLIRKLNLTDMNYKQVDQGLWLLGKYSSLKLRETIPADLDQKITALLQSRGIL